MTMRRRRITVLAAAVLVLGSLQAATAAPGIDLAATVAPDNGRTCRTSNLPVDLELGLLLAPGAPVSVPIGDLAGPQHVLVKLCLPDGPPPSTVQLLVHGITYDHRYWNIADPADPASNRYSWEAAAAGAGYATLAIDRIGNGQSSHPISALVDINSNASVVHQVVQALRAGAIESPGSPVAFDKVVLVGHSYGSMTAWFAASRYQDVDGLIITGATHNVREVQAPLSVEANHYPAMLDPQFASSGLDPGYVTSRPGTRAALFYTDYAMDDGLGVDPRIIERDEQTKGTVTQFELVNYPIVFRTALDIRTPVLLVIGDQDVLFCGQAPLDLGAPCSSATALVASEAHWYGPSASLDAVILRGTGHNLNAFPSAPRAFGMAMDWLTAAVPPSG
jgi:pimeloyl-ACP methyl ester carboxylesterase